MAGVGTNYTNHAFSTNDLAIAADFFNGSGDFHFFLLRHAVGTDGFAELYSNDLGKPLLQLFPKGVLKLAFFSSDSYCCDIM